MARWIDNALATRGRCVSVAAGNAGQVSRAPTPHAAAPRTDPCRRVLAATNLRQELGWVVGGEGISDFSENEMEIWYGPQDRFDVEVRPPGGAWVGPVPLGKASGTPSLRRRDGAQHPHRDLPPGERPEPDLDPALPVLRDRQGDAQENAADHLRRVAGAADRHGRARRAVRRVDRARRRSGLQGPGGMWNYPSTFSEGSYTNDRMIGSLACAERLLSVATPTSLSTPPTSPPVEDRPATAAANRTSQRMARTSSQPPASTARRPGWR